ncbi:MAG: nucleotidyltransferase family protein [Gammaproteobacteria bacterium]|nr:nucleotidyltransferase family protein [Gammaproteobacteria bacterium]
MKHKLVLSQDTSLYSAIKLLDENGNGVLPVVNLKNEFVGLITDGDIRKAILNNKLDLDHILNKNPFKMDYRSTTKQKIQFLKKIHRRHLPLVDENNIYVDLFVLDEIDFNRKPNCVVIMAGGLGSRLGSLTENMPKPMLSVGGIPILETILNMFVEHGFNKFKFSVNYKKEKIMNYFGNGEKWGIEISYLVEDKRLGTAGALSLIDEKLADPLLVINGDVLTALDIEEFLNYHNQLSSDATMCVFRHDHTVPFGVVESSSDRFVGIVEKPIVSHEVNAGIYIINPDYLEFIPKETFFDMTNLFEEMSKQNKSVYIYRLKDAWIDVGHIEDYRKVCEMFEYE